MPLEVNYLHYRGIKLTESSWCSIPFTEDSVDSLYMMILSTVIYFLAPLLILLALYVRILLCLWESCQTGESQCQSQASRYSSPL